MADVAPDLLQIAIETFLDACRHPAVLEYGENAIPLTQGCYSLEIRSGKLFIEIWEEKRSVSRRILTIERTSVGILDCSVQRFGGKPGRLTFLDLERPQTAHRTLCGTRQNFAEQFRSMLQRQFPGWEVEALSSALDLQRSFSSVFPRAKLVRGNHILAAMACPGPQDEPGLLAFALIWHNHVRLSEHARGQTSLILFLPESAGNLTAQRLRWLRGESLTPRIFRFNEHGSAGEIDPQDLGNLQTRVTSLYIPPHLTPELEGLLSRIEKIDGVGYLPELNGSISIRSRGLEFARIENRRLFLGIESKEEISVSRIGAVAQFAETLSALAAAAGSAVPGSHAKASHNGQSNGSYARKSTPPHYSERWFESAVRSNLALVDPELILNPIHGQVISFAAGDRDLIDLLAVSGAGRLFILELKTAEDIHLPLQALDYWMRVAWHLERDELRHLFPGTVLENRPPKLMLVAPAMTFHSSNATLLRYFSPEIEVERVGVNLDWQQSFKVVMRLKSADVPISHWRSQ